MSENKNLPALPDVLVNVTPAVIEANIEDLKAALIAQVTEQSNTVVTVDNLQASKKLMADMNKTTAAIKAARIKYAKAAGVNITAFETEMKALEKIGDDGVLKIKAQAEVFEKEEKARALAALQAYLVEQGTAKGIRPQFQRATVDDLSNLSTLTDTGKLAAKPKAEVDARVAADLALQQQTDMRLVMLENESLKAGLAAPLTQNHVELFLYEPDDVYKMRLAHLFEAELQREVKARAAAEQRAADEQRRNAEAQQRAAEAEARAAQQAEQNRLLQEQQEQQRQQQAEQMRLQQEQHQRELAAAKANLAQQVPTVAVAAQDRAVNVNPEAAQSGGVSHFVISPVGEAEVNPACRVKYKGDESGAAAQAMQIQSKNGSSEIWKHIDGKWQCIAVVLTGQAAIDYRNAVKAGV